MREQTTSGAATAAITPVKTTGAATTKAAAAIASLSTSSRSSPATTFGVPITRLSTSSLQINQISIHISTMGITKHNPDSGMFTSFTAQPAYIHFSY